MALSAPSCRSRDATIRPWTSGGTRQNTTDNPGPGTVFELAAHGIGPLGSRRLGARFKTVQEYRVLIDLPVPLPVTDTELDLLERELGPVLAELLKASS